MKVTKYVYWHFNGKVRVSGSKKDIDGKIIVSSSAVMPRSDKAMLKYSVKNY